MKQARTKQHLFILAGEPSGDLHASQIVKALQNEFHFSGVAGPALCAAGVDSLMPMEKFAVMGFSDVLKALPSLYKQFYIVRDAILRVRPQGVLFVDYPGFNLRMAKALRRSGYTGKLIHYICPSVWAWGKKRIEHMASTLDMLLTIYPFEAAHFAHTALPVKYVGNPLQEYISQHAYDDNWKSHFPIGNSPLIALFPGSRRGEIERNLPKQLQAVALFQKKYPEVAFGISNANPALKQLIDDKIDEKGIQQVFTVPKTYTYELMRDCHSAVAKSGTVTLELALHRCPTVVVYELSTLNWLIAKFLIRLNLPHYCIVNILNNKRIFPELIEKGFDSKNLSHHLEEIYCGVQRKDCLKGCDNIIDLFQHSTVSHNAAQAIRDLLS